MISDNKTLNPADKYPQHRIYNLNFYLLNVRLLQNYSCSHIYIFQDLVSVVVEGEAEGSVTSLQTETLFLQMPSSSLVQADLDILVTALESVYEDAGAVFHLLIKCDK